MTRILLRGGYVHTPADPHATALLVDDGHVVWTGDDEASQHFTDGVDRVVELDGRLVTPAFVDAHVHLAATGFATAGVDLSGATSAEHALELLAAHATLADDTVLTGHGWDETGWPDPDAFTREALDVAVGHRPAYVSRVDVHSALASTALVAVATTDEDERISGLDGWSEQGPLSRDAHHAVRDAVRGLQGPKERKAAIRRALESAAAAGVGMVHELGAPHINAPTDLGLARELREEAAAAGRTLPEVVGYWGDLSTDVALEQGLPGAAGDICVDGAIGSHTAALSEPYADAPHRGHLYLTAEQVADHVVACTEAGLQAGFHVIGDRAATEVVAGFDLAAERLGDAAIVRGRHRLEHLEMVTPEQIARLGELGVTASVQPAFDRWWGGPDGVYRQRLGERSAGMNPFASMSRAGIALAFGSDSPVTPFDPWGAVLAAVWHHDEAERLTVRAAFNAHTRGGWRAAGRDEGGVIAIGAPAHLAVWDVPGALTVQTPDERIAAWSTDPRAGVAHLPEVHPDHPLPTCALLLVAGAVAHDPAGLLPDR